MRHQNRKARRCLSALILPALFFSLSLGCGNRGQVTTAEASGKLSELRTAEPKSGESKSVEPEVQSEIGKMEAEKRATLLKDAQSALEETRNAIAALDKGDKKAALAALSSATGKLDLVVSREPSLAFAPVAIATTLYDLYAKADTVKAMVRLANEDLSNNQVQDARRLLEGLTSQAEIHVTELPLATYPVAIKSVVPLIDAGRTDDAKAALYTALNTLVVETYIVPLPQLRAEMLVKAASKLAAKNNRTEDDNKLTRSLIDAARNEIQLAEALGYGSKADYKPLYSQIDEIQKQTSAGQSGQPLFDKLRESIKSFKFVSHDRS
jgi:hypothetical protein